MNTQQLRQSVQEKWLDYYIENRSWITRLQIWVNCDGQRRPSSSFILATLSILEPSLNQLLPLVVDLSSNPDRIVAALGLNFNPDEHPIVVERLQAGSVQDGSAQDITASDELTNPSPKMLPAAPRGFPVSPPQVSNLVSKIDEVCEGGRYRKSSDSPS